MIKEEFSLELLFSQVQKDFEANVRLLEKRDRDLAERLKIFKYSIFYSNPFITLKPGTVYFLGINPKGENKEDYELETYKCWVQSDIEYNSLDSNFEDWGRSLQNRCKEILNFVIDELKLDINYKDILSTNFNFFRSNNVHELKNIFEIKFESCWKYHEMLLNIVKPKIIICYGNREKDCYFDSGYRFLRDKFNTLEEETYPHYEKLLLKKSIIKIPEIGEILLIGLPHLSIYPPDKTTYSILKSWIQDFNVNYEY